jgi:tRNA(Ile)-lysidine synthase
LLQALRGGGPAGLSAMPQESVREGLTWARPWLTQPREAIDAYVRRHRLKHVEDESNADPRHARSRLRHDVWPTLVRAFPDAEITLGRAASRAQEAAALAVEVAAADLPAVREEQALRVKAWLALPPARRRNALRGWLAEALHEPVPESLVERLCAELPRRRGGRWPAPSAELRMYRGTLMAVDVADEGAASADVEKVVAVAGREPVVVDLHVPGEHRLAPWAGRLVVCSAADGGVPAAMLRQVVVRDREGGETFRAAPRAMARSLKKQYQAMGVPAWDRTGPLLYTAAGDLLFVPGLGIAADLRAAPGEPQLSMRWVPDAPSPPPAPTGHRQPGG